MNCHTHILYTIPCLLRSHAVTGVDFFSDEHKSQDPFLYNVLQTLVHIPLVLRKPLQSGSGWHATRSCHYLQWYSSLLLLQQYSLLKNCAFTCGNSFPTHCTCKEVLKNKSIVLSLLHQLWPVNVLHY